MKIALLLLTLVTASFACLAQSGVYKRVDQEGRTFYSDVQEKGAREIDLPEITVVPATRIPAKPATIEGAAMTGQHEQVDKQVDSSINQMPQLSDHDRVQQLIEEMGLYEDSIEALEIELYNLGGDY